MSSYIDALKVIKEQLKEIYGQDVPDKVKIASMISYISYILGEE